MERQGVVNCFRMCRVAVFLAVLVFLVGNGWATCQSGNYYFNYDGPGVCVEGGCSGSCSKVETMQATCAMSITPSDRRYTNCKVRGVQVDSDGETLYCSGGFVGGCRSRKALKITSINCETFCTTQCEADSVANYSSCIASGKQWQNCECVESPPPKPEDCTTRRCCDSMNVVLPIQTDTSWLGCVPTDLSGGCSTILDKLTPGDTAVAATCSGKTVYKICTTEYMWDGTNHCRQLPTANCAEITVNDSMCTDVVCYAVQQHFLSDLDYNELTQCYTGTESIQNLVQCTNGVRGDGGSYDRPFQVCDSYLQAHGLSIGQYIAGRSGVTGGSGGISMTGGGGVSGGGGSGGGQGGCVGNGCNDEGFADNGMPAAYGGGESVDAQGNTVQNSPSPGLGGTYTNTPHIATSVNPSTGEPEIIKNSDGMDSVYVSNTFTQVQCIGFSNGIATMTNGFSTWTCEALSCSQALFSASLSGGRCSGSGSGIANAGDPNPQMPKINGDTSQAVYGYSEFESLEKGLNMLTSALNSQLERDKRQRDSLMYVFKEYMNDKYQLVYGEDYDALGNIKRSVDSVRIAVNNASAQNSSAIASAVSSVGTGLGNVENAVNNVRTSVNNASTNISTAVGNASTNISGAVASGASNVSSAVGQVKLSVDDVNSSIVTQGGNIKQSVDNVGGYVQATTTTLRDTVHQTNEILRSIEGAVSDTGPNIPRSIWSVDSNLSSLPRKMDSSFSITLDQFADDRLVSIMDTNVAKVTAALDNMNVDVSLDSVRVVVPRDSILDSIRSDIMSHGDFDFVMDTTKLDFAAAYQAGYDSSAADTAGLMPKYDSTLVKYIESHFYVDGSDVTDPTNVDSLTGAIQSRLDSANQAFNAKSDSSVRARTDTLLKYSGVDSAGAAIRRVFDGPSVDCPKECIDIKITTPQMMGGRPVDINFSQILCDMKLFGLLNFFGFCKMILRLMTAILCVYLIWNSFGQKVGAKGGKH